MRSVAIGALFGFLRSAAVADKSVTAAGVTVRIKGQSGKMTLTLPGVGENASDTEVNCEMSALRQLDAKGTTLGQGGRNKHSFNSFATQDFTFSEPASGKYGGLDVAKVTFQSTLVGNSYLKIETMIFKEEGSFKVGNDTVNVTNGTVKFNVFLGDWSWCGENGVTCVSSPGVGDSVELDISVQGKGTPSAKGSGTGAGTAFDLGGGSQLVMLSTYSTDDGATWETMPSGYPKVRGSTFTLRFPKWNGTVSYDPLIASARETDSTGPTGSTDGTVAASFASTAGTHLALVAVLVGLARAQA